MPPSFATAAAREARETLTPMPPWTMGNLAVSLPILSLGISTSLSVVLAEREAGVPASETE